MDLETIKKQQDLYTHKADDDVELPWSCWDEFEDPAEYLGNYGDHAMGFGNTEKQAVEKFLGIELDAVD